MEPLQRVVKPLQRIHTKRFVGCSNCGYHDFVNILEDEPTECPACGMCQLHTAKVKEYTGHIIDELCPTCGNHLAAGNNLIWCSYIHCNYWREKC